MLAGDVWRLNRLYWVMLTSLLKTLAGKHDSTVTKVARRHRATIEPPHGPRKCIQVSVPRGDGKKPLVATFGGIPLTRQKNAILRNREPARANTRRKELVHRLLAGRCELCGQADKVRVHQIRKLADLTKPGQPQPDWMQICTRLAPRRPKLSRRLSLRLGERSSDRRWVRRCPFSSLVQQ
jgi:hypothetical protein